METRTELVGGTSVNWSVGDQLSVVVNNSELKSSALESTTTTATFNVNGVAESETGYTIQAVYPAAANKGASDTEKYPNIYKIETATEQTPSVTSFDGASDMLVAKEVTSTEQPSELSMQFTRLVALGQMTLTGFELESAISKVTFSTDDAALTGRSYVNLSTAEVDTYGYTNQAFKNVVLNYEGAEDWSNGYTIYFTCFPAELTTGFTVVVETADGTKYSKSVTFTDGKTLSFTAGDMTRFKVNMKGTKVVIADNTDVLDLAFTGVTTGTSYTEWSGKTATSNAVYAGQSAGGNSSIQLRSTNSNSGIVTTTSGGKVTKVAVTWNSNTTNGRTLNIYGKNTAYTAATDLYDNSTQGTLLGTIVCGTSTELVIEKDIYKYIGLRSNSGAMYIDEIQITWAEMTADDVIPAEQLAMPNLTASVTEDSITVKWDAVANAENYEVSINDDNSTTATTTNTEYTFSDLTTGQEYTITVVAKGNGEATTDSDKATITATPEEVVLTSATISFASTDQRISQDSNTQVWKNDGITFTNNKSSSSTNVANYSNPVRLYKGSEVIVEADSISSIVFTCNSTSYANVLKTSLDSDVALIDGASATASGSSVTVKFSTSVKSFKISALTGQVRMDSLTVNF